MASLRDCFAHSSATSRNSRWSWSARSANGKIVVLALFKHLIDYNTEDRKPIYSEYQAANEHWINRLGNIERLENLRWARDNCDGIFCVVVVKAKDERADQLEIEESYPVTWRMKIKALDERSGEFRAEYHDNQPPI